MLIGLQKGEQLRDLGRKRCFEKVLDRAPHRKRTGCFHQDWVKSTIEPGASSEITR